MPDAADAALPAHACQTDRPWSLRPEAEGAPHPLVGTVLLPVAPADLPPAPPATVGYPADGDGYVATRAALAAPEPAFIDVCKGISQWLSHTPASGGTAVAGGPTLLTRILSVLCEVALPTVHPGAPDHDYLRSQIGFCPVPGGNLDSLLRLAWRFSVQLARHLRTQHSVLSQCTDVGRFEALLGEVFVHATPMPAHDYSSRSDELPLWAGSSLQRAVRAACRQVERAVVCARRADAKTARGRVYSMRECSARGMGPSTAELARATRQNFLAYRMAAEDLLEGVTALLRACGTASARTWQILHPQDPVMGPPSMAFVSNGPVSQRVRAWHRAVEFLDPVADQDPALLDGHLCASYAEAYVPFSWYVHCENALAGRWRDFAWIGTGLAWGVLPGEADAPHFAGRFRPSAGAAPILDPTVVYGREITFTPPAGYVQPDYLALLARASRTAPRD